jgi:hypothetical protein
MLYWYFGGAFMIFIGIIAYLGLPMDVKNLSDPFVAIGLIFLIFGVRDELLEKIKKKGG